ncbi:solute carrier family 52, riboflavin transporter, member 3-A-like [Myxocyprinus asiaticus]|uniref:solute carrier family 52, riboflavin transporter, member 3-A-like n=1 Tax=Myxocyprinus asiaticus TaxID=70543 RepID=UPI0022225365|nr:solute carrier family 52, riboflavin transporter, member 3-A-like [Myxocyprinus asiaticus]XP_051525228.1 solute carrier family 52, riboflavin transporter, member 3-A-like [Myxocyprinus asiaticus]XP_051525229.1 solute carrier family 52, riboflavin transporter, member 3-A-like [Myxocyprinus asiaticus]XP_051525230.1 solute carrier family 52, riboflavin transporter, member 3-A-like [Myxocyprinus asiaticus]
MPLYTHALACAFGLGSWVSINGLWVELPMIVNILLEGWDLPSYLTVIIQLANLGPLLVTLAHKFCPGRLRENLVIYTVLLIGVVACVLLALFWKNTTVLLGQRRSTAFFILTFFLASVDCTSSVTFLPFMMQLPAKYITTYFIGEGLSGLVPGLVALAQGVGMSKCVNVSHTSDNLTDPGDTTYVVETQYLPPNFSTEIFFFFLAVMTAISLGAFFILNRVPRTFELSTENLVPGLDAVATVCRGLEDPTGPEKDEKKQTKVPILAPLHTGYQLTFIYFMVVWVNGATNGLLPSVQTFSCMPYGNMAYHLSAALSSVANPVACIIAMFFPKRSLVFLGFMCLLGSGFGGYNMAMAAMSPCPLLQDTPVGDAIIVLSWVFFTGLLSYVKVMVGVILRDRSHSALVWCGAAAQAGSLLGSVIMFPLINIYHLFQSGDICNTVCPLS